MTEAELLGSVLDYAWLKGCLVHHDRPARTKHGWVTPVQGNAGFPDVVIVGPNGVLFAELKKASSVLTAAQRQWLDRLGPHGRLWRPVHWHDGSIRADIDRIGR